MKMGEEGKRMIQIWLENRLREGFDRGQNTKKEERLERGKTEEGREREKLDGKETK